MFTVLCEQYQPSLRRDPMYNEVRAGEGELGVGRRGRGEEGGEGGEAGGRAEKGEKLGGGGRRGEKGEKLGGGGGEAEGLGEKLPGTAPAQCPPPAVPRQDRTALLRRAAQADVILRRLAR